MSQLTYGIAASRALRLRCPRCGEGPLFKNLLSMYERCPNCSLKYERAPGYFLGSIYINYGFISITMTAMYMGFHYGLGISNEVLTIPLLAYCVIVSVVLFRYARAWWLAMDCLCDPVGFGMHVEEEPTQPPEKPAT